MKFLASIKRISACEFLHLLVRQSVCPSVGSFIGLPKNHMHILVRKSVNPLTLLHFTIEKKTGVKQLNSKFGQNPYKVW